MDLQLDGVAKDAQFDDAKINGGVWIQFDSAEPDPDTGKPYPLFLGGDESKPQRALVRSYRCRAIKDAEKALQKSGFVKVRLARKKDKDDVIAENSVLPEDKRFGFFLVALENMSAAGGVQQVKYEDAVAFHGMDAYANFVDQIRDAAYDDTLYVLGEGGDAGNAGSKTSLTSSTSKQTTQTESLDPVA